MAEAWSLDPSITYLNHGAFGACPVPVVEDQRQWRERMEAEPVRFLDRELEGLLDETRTEVGAAIAADPAGIVFVPNATTAVNTVLAGVPLGPGDEILMSDHEYGACINAARRVAHDTGARLVLRRLPFPLPDPEMLVEGLVAGVTSRTRLAIISHVTSSTALVFPLDEVVRRLAAQGIDVLVDGAHAPGQVPVDIGRLANAGMVWYAGDGHKWWCGPRGSGFLWVREDRRSGMRPLVTSHGATSPRTDRPRFLLEFDWTGTLDPTPWLALPAAIRFVASLLPGGADEVMAANHELAVQARDILCSALGIAPPAPAGMVASMAAIPLPIGAGTGAMLQRRLFHTSGIEVPVSSWPGPAVGPAADATTELLRVSAQRYNEPADYSRLADALPRLLRELA